MDASNSDKICSYNGAESSQIGTRSVQTGRGPGGSRELRDREGNGKGREGRAGTGRAGKAREAPGRVGKGRELPEMMI